MSKEAIICIWTECLFLVPHPSQRINALMTIDGCFYISLSVKQQSSVNQWFIFESAQVITCQRMQVFAFEIVSLCLMLCPSQRISALMTIVSCFYIFLFEQQSIIDQWYFFGSASYVISQEAIISLDLHKIFLVKGSNNCI